MVHQEKEKKGLAHGGLWVRKSEGTLTVGALGGGGGLRGETKKASFKGERK